MKVLGFTPFDTSLFFFLWPLFVCSCVYAFGCYFLVWCWSFVVVPSFCPLNGCFFLLLNLVRFHKKKGLIVIFFHLTIKSWKTCCLCSKLWIPLQSVIKVQSFYLIAKRLEILFISELFVFSLENYLTCFKHLLGFWCGLKARFTQRWQRK
jgi:hypothetical protein